MRILATTLAFLLTLAVVAPPAFFAFLLLAGPHGLLDSRLQLPGVVVVWLLVLGLPVLAARAAWRRFRPPPAP